MKLTSALAVPPESRRIDGARPAFEAGTSPVAFARLDERQVDLVFPTADRRRIEQRSHA
jgi:hypothetical protein